MSTPQTPASTGVVQITALRKLFPTDGGRTFAAVDGIDLATTPGEFLTLLGPSGCGKTTTLRMVAGFETPTEGAITLDGQDMLRLTPDKRPMSMVFQSYALFPHMTVRENVAYGLKLAKTPPDQRKAKVDKSLESMGLTTMAERAPNQLSGGQQQRVALARAMVMSPKVLLFDEPLSNLDAKLRVQMRSEIRRMQQEAGITALYVTHDQDEAMSLSDRILVMNKGLIEQLGKPADIYRKPNTKFVADFIGEANFVAATLTSVRDGMARVQVFGEDRTIPATPGVVDGATVEVLVRPESMTVTPAPQAADIIGNTGQILTAVFYGSVVEYLVATNAGKVKVVVSDPDADAILQPGEHVAIDFPTDRGWVLPV